MMSMTVLMMKANKLNAKMKYVLKDASLVELIGFGFGGLRVDGGRSEES